MSKLSGEFAMKDLGPLCYFLGISVTRHSYGIFLSQHKYVEEIIERAAMSSCKPVSTPVDTKAKLSGLSGNPYHDPSEYRSLAGALQYLTFTRSDIAYAVQQVCLFMHDPRTQHMIALKRIIRYIKGTIHHGLHISPSLVDSLTTYTDADWGDAQILDALRLDIVSILGIIWSLGLQNDNQPYPALVLKPNIVVLPMLLLNLAGFETYF
jgi:hypothetical protein